MTNADFLKLLDSVLDIKLKPINDKIDKLQKDVSIIKNELKKGVWEDIVRLDNRVKKIENQFSNL